jgi:hypothetical protein
MEVLEHFHFYSVQASVAKCGFSWGKAAPGLVTLYTPEVKMLYCFTAIADISIFAPPIKPAT